MCRVQRSLPVGRSSLALPGTLFALQQGNFQVSATPLAALGFALLLAGRSAREQRSSAWTAAAKIFPGILVVHLVAARRWRAVAWVAGTGIALLALTLAVQGTRPVQDFVTHAMPQIADAGAFPQTEIPATRARELDGLRADRATRATWAGSMTKPVGLAIASIYGVLVIALAAFAGWRRPLRDRHAGAALGVLQVAVALVGLAAFRSPFAGAHYGAVSTLCLFALLAAGTSSYRDVRLWMIGMVVYGLTVWSIPSPPSRARRMVGNRVGVACGLTVAVNVWVDAACGDRSDRRPRWRARVRRISSRGAGAPAASAAPL